MGTNPQESPSVLGKQPVEKADVLGASGKQESGVCSAFGQGAAASRKGGYRSDNPHAYGSELWAVWIEGFEFEEGPQYVALGNQQAKEPK